MNFSLVLFFHEGNFENASNIFNKLKKQSDQHFDVLLFNNLQEPKTKKQFYNLVNEYNAKKSENKFGIEIIDSFAVNTLKSCFNNTLNYLSSDYVYFLDDCVSLSKDFVKSINKIINSFKNKKQKVDIINCGLQIKNIFNTRNTWYTDINGFLNLNENKTGLSFLDPLIASKIFRVKFLHRHELYFKNNPSFDFYFLHLTYLSAYNVYFLFDEKLLTLNKVFPERSFSISDTTKNIKSTLDYYKLQNKFDLHYQELEYNLLCHLNFYLWCILYFKGFLNADNYTFLQKEITTKFNQEFSESNLNIYLNISDNYLNNFIQENPNPNFNVIQKIFS